MFDLKLNTKMFKILKYLIRKVDGVERRKLLYCIEKVKVSRALEPMHRSLPPLQLGYSDRCPSQREVLSVPQCNEGSYACLLNEHNITALKSPHLFNLLPI